MGGNAFKDAVTTRIPGDDFVRYRNDVMSKLLDKLDCGSVWRVESYRDKPDHGDLDLVLVWRVLDVNQLVQDIKRVFKTEHVVRSGPTISFLYQDHQVDLIFANSNDEAEFASAYFSWNDLGNFIGRAAKRLGFKFGHNGLRYVLRDPTNPVSVVAEIVVTMDVDAALDFLGYSSKRHLRGFDTKQQIFEYATSSPYFDPSSFVLANRNSESRRRDRTRKMYQEMLEYLKEHHGLTDDMPRKDVDKETHLRRAFEAFPEFEGQYYYALEQMRQQIEFKARFNGENYSSWFGVTGKDLGTLMAAHRRYFEQHKLVPWLTTLPVPAFRDVVRSLDEFLCVGEV